MKPVLVVIIDPLRYDLLSLFKGFKIVKPNTLLLEGVLPPWKATSIKQPGVVDRIVFSTLLGSYIPEMNEACCCCNYRSTEI